MSGMGKWSLSIVLLGASLQLIQSEEAAKGTVSGGATAVIDPRNTALHDEQLRNLTGAVDAAHRAYLSAWGGTEAEGRWQTYAALNATNIPAIMQLAGKGPFSSTAIESLVWVVTNGQVQAGSRQLRPYGFQAVELLQTHGYTTNPAVGPICQGFGNNWDWCHRPSIAFLEEVISKNPNHDARGQATYALAKLTKEKAEMLGWLENAPMLLRDDLRESVVEAAKKANASTVLGEAERLFQDVIRSYSNCPTAGKPGSTLGARSASELYEIHHLWTGNVAPEVEGEDLDGVKMRLSDYRGKVVVLSFWASWCGPCMAMVPHERSLVEHMAGKPFALVGVNSDSTRAEGRRAVEEERITWRSFWCGTNGSAGAIPTAWNVHGWPTVYVLDPKGTIRLKLLGFGGTNSAILLRETVERLLKESPERERKEQ